MDKKEIGLIGLGVMGRNFLLNIAEKGYSVLGYDIDRDKIAALSDQNPDFDIAGVNDIHEFLENLKSPRKVILLVPAGIVDEVLKNISSLLEEDDILIDGGNSHPFDTERRIKEMEKKGIHYIGMGISGGSHGARYGPSMMPGGDQKAYEHLEHIFTAAAAKVKGEACVKYMGKGAAGHFVKMVHNGIEYGLMQLISEVYDILRNGLGLNNQHLHKVFAKWNNSPLASYLIEITADIFEKQDPDFGGYIVDHILDSAAQKGTGKWTSQIAMDLGVPVPVIDAAVSMRYLSAMKPERMKAEEILDGADIRIKGNKEEIIDKLQGALHFAMLLTYSQGFELLRIASREYGFGLNLADIAAIWRGGCIIRSAMLEDIRKAFNREEEIPNLLFDPELSELAESKHHLVREVTGMAVAAAIPVPAFSGITAYFDAFRSGRLPANLIQAQRDYFGGHKYKRIGEDGIYHTDW